MTKNLSKDDKSQLNRRPLYKHNMIGTRRWSHIFLSLYIVLYLPVLQCLFHIFKFSTSLFSVFSSFCIFRVYFFSILWSFLFFPNSQFFTYILTYLQVFYIFRIFQVFSRSSDVEGLTLFVVMNSLFLLKFTVNRTYSISCIKSITKLWIVPSGR